MNNVELYKETHRPQFHFTAKENWLNDPNDITKGIKGCVNLYALE